MYTLAEDSTSVSYEWCAGKTFSCNTDSRMPEAFQAPLPRVSIFSEKVRRNRPRIIIKGGYVKNKNSKRCLVMAGKIFRGKISAASKVRSNDMLISKAL